jgi:xanthine dehydrogenase YagS FAD-binding subunit
MRAARIVAGGVGTVPWRLAACESELTDQPVISAVLARAARAAAEHAAPLTHNAFKATLLQRAVQRALHLVLADVIESRS